MNPNRNGHNILAPVGALVIVTALLPYAAAGGGLPIDPIGDPCHAFGIDCDPESYPPECERKQWPGEGERPDLVSDVLCPEPTYGASCVAHGLVVIETDKTGAVGTVVQAFATSRAATTPTFGPIPYAFDPFIPSTYFGPISTLFPSPTADAHATELGIAYAHPFLPLAAASRTVFSDCEVKAHMDYWGYGFYAEAWGRAGAEDLRLDAILAPILEAQVLDQELNELNLNYLVGAAHQCDALQLVVVSPVIDYCPAPNTGFSTGGPVSVTVILNEANGPLFSTGIIAQTAAAHVIVDSPTTRVDMYVGYVATLVPWGGIVFPFPMWLP